MEQTSISYYLCDYCPFLSITKDKLTIHTSDMHPSKKPIDVCELKCPACLNKFFKVNILEMHLTQDHLLSSEDLERVINVVIQAQTVSYTKPILPHIDQIPNKEIETNQQKSISPLQYEVRNRINYVKPIENLQKLPENSNNTKKTISSLDDKSFEVKIIEKLPTSEDNGQFIQNEDNIDSDNYDNEDSQEQDTHKSITKKSDLPEYTNEYLSSKLYKCKIPKCRTQMKDLTKLDYHAKCHSKTKFACPEPNCRTSYTVWKSLVAHLWRLHKIDMELFKCDLCEYRTHSYSKLLTQHRATHGDVRSFNCDYQNCNKAFKNSKQLRNHRDYVHKEQGKSCTEDNGGSTMFRCVECDKPFARKRQMNVHMDTVHRKIKPHVCSFCGYNTSSRGALNIHVRIHTGEKPFKCNECDYSSNDHNSLRRHKLRHRGDKPYKCPHCDYACIQSSTYKMHVKMKHPTLNKALLFSCPLCNFHSVNNVVYTGHMYSQHPEYAEKNMTKPSQR